MANPSWFSKFFSADFGESSKRLILIALVSVFVVSHFLLMYIKVEIANRQLVEESQWYLFLLIVIFGGYVSAEMITNLFRRKAELQAGVDTVKARTGTPDTTVQVDNVENVDAKNVNLDQQAKT